MRLRLIVTENSYIPLLATSIHPPPKTHDQTPTRADSNLPTLQPSNLPTAAPTASTGLRVALVDTVALLSLGSTWIVDSFGTTSRMWPHVAELRRLAQDFAHALDPHRRLPRILDVNPLPHACTMSWPSGTS